MNSILKVLAGAILLGGGLYIIWKYTLDEFYIFLKGFIPPFLVVLGLLIIWIEMDEMKTKKK